LSNYWFNVSVAVTVGLVWVGWCHKVCWEKRLFFSPWASSDALQFFAKCVVKLGCRHGVIVSLDTARLWY
jgi:hypothetical protein